MKGIGVHVDSEIKLVIHSLEEEKTIKNMKTEFNTFTARFSANIFLPDFIGLGKSVSKGFGIVSKINDEK